MQATYSLQLRLHHFAQDEQRAGDPIPLGGRKLPSIESQSPHHPESSHTGWASGRARSNGCTAEIAWAGNASVGERPSA
eukprot:4013351-Alexandrium_andersonii.AAC.1